jgi:S-adenosylmethionine:tRNA ribosyltransferase-isomerase
VTTLAMDPPLSLLDATEPPEARGLTRDSVRLLVGRRSTGQVSHHMFAELPSLLCAGDIVVVNTSATLPAAVPVPGTDLTVHFSTERPDGRWLVELRARTGSAEPYAASAGKPTSAGPNAASAGKPTSAGPNAASAGKRTSAGSGPYREAVAGSVFALPGAAILTLEEPYSAGRLWVASLSTGGVDRLEYLHRHGSPIRYAYVSRAWPLSAYQTVFALHPGSAEMPSAGRPFTDGIVTRLVTAGVLVVPVLLHTGVASPEAHERPYPERFAVPASTARAVSAARAAGGRVIAIGTTVVRALESAVDREGELRPASGITDLVVTPERGVRVVDGLLTGFHEPTASHRDLLAAVAGQDLLDACYGRAAAAGYRWHEFGDVNLLLP